VSQAGEPYLYHHNLDNGPGPARPDLKELEFLCAFEVNFIVHSYVHALYLHRSAEADAAWAVDLEWEFDPGGRPYAEAALEAVRARQAQLKCLVAVRPLGARRAAMRFLLEQELGGCGFGAMPDKFMAAGIARRRDYMRLYRKRKGQWERKKALVASRRPAIADAAEELGLQPRACGDLGWVANCPGGRHLVFLDYESNSFKCPWCRRHGGAEELRAFAAHPEVADGERTERVPPAPAAGQ